MGLRKDHERFAAERCARCFLRKADCLCAELPRIEAATRLVIVRHSLERFKVSNTGRLAAMTVAGATMIDHAVRDDAGAAADAAPIALPDDGLATYILYPDGPELAAPPPAPIRLVVLDGTWPQARRMLQRIDALRGLPRLALPAPVLARPRLRRTKGAAEMSTIEAIAAALAWLEGDEVAAPLFELFDRFVERATYAGPRNSRGSR